jgi:hypothetical protein
MLVRSATYAGSVACKSLSKTASCSLAASEPSLQFFTRILWLLLVVLRFPGCHPFRYTLTDRENVSSARLARVPSRAPIVSLRSRTYGILFDYIEFLCVRLTGRPLG